MDRNWIRAGVKKKRWCGNCISCLERGEAPASWWCGRYLDLIQNPLCDCSLWDISYVADKYWKKLIGVTDNLIRKGSWL